MDDYFDMDNMSIGMASELFNLDLDDIKLTPSLLDNEDDADENSAEKFDY